MTTTFATRTISADTINVWAFAGSRELALSTDQIQEVVRRVWYAFDVPPVDAIATGDARGVDSSASDFADLHFLPCMVFQARWNKYGKSAGMIRSRQMLQTKPAIVVCITLGYTPTLDDARRERLNVGTMQTWAMAQEEDTPALLIAYDNGRFRAKKAHALTPRQKMEV